MGFNGFSGLDEGLVLLKELSKPSALNRTYMRKSILKMWFQCLFGLTRRVGAIERLIQTFDAKIKIMKYEQYSQQRSK